MDLSSMIAQQINTYTLLARHMVKSVPGCCCNVVIQQHMVIRPSYTWALTLYQRGQYQPCCIFWLFPPTTSINHLALIHAQASELTLLVINPMCMLNRRGNKMGPQGVPHNSFLRGRSNYPTALSWNTLQRRSPAQLFRDT